MPSDPPDAAAAARARRGATVELRHVSKRFDGSPAGPDSPAAVNDLSLAVDAGELCVLVGPSGCGKTTALRMINRLIEPSAGQVLLDGRDVAREDATLLRRRIGYVIQQTGLFPHQTIAENVGTVPRLLGWPASRIAARVDELLALVGLEPGRVRTRFPAELSGGERQRVGVARALAAEPPLLLMDEPFGAVDPIVRTRLQDELQRIHAALGTTIIFVTHDIDEAIKLGDRVAVLQQGGKLAQYARPAELLAQPASDFVARFVGGDRALKRLALLAVADASLCDVPTLHAAESGATTGAGGPTAGEPYLLVLDDERRPVRWVRAQALAAGDPPAPDPSSGPPVVLRDDSTLRDALSQILGTSEERGVVVDAAGRYRGVLTVEAVGAALRATAYVAPPASGAADAAPAASPLAEP